MDGDRGTELAWQIANATFTTSAWLVLRFGHSRRLLDRLGFASSGFEEAPTTWLTTWLMTISMTDQNEHIFITARLSGRISLWLCSQSPNYRAVHCKVSEIFVVLRVQWWCHKVVQIIKHVWINGRWLYCLLRVTNKNRGGCFTLKESSVESAV